MNSKLCHQCILLTLFTLKYINLTKYMAKGSCINKYSTCMYSYPSAEHNQVSELYKGDMYRVLCFV